MDHRNVREQQQEGRVAFKPKSELSVSLRTAYRLALGNVHRDMHLRPTAPA